MPQQIPCNCGGTMQFDFIYWPVFNEHEDFYKCTTCERVISGWEAEEEMEERQQVLIDRETTGGEGE